MNPFYISGLTQADGSFFVLFEKRKKKTSASKSADPAISAHSRAKLRIKPTFTITLDLCSKSALEAVRNFFCGIGRVDENRQRHSVEFVVTSIPQLWQKIVPHFLKYPLYGDKKESFSIFMQVVQALWEKKHCDNQELARLVKLSFALPRLDSKNTKST